MLFPADVEMVVQCVEEGRLGVSSASKLLSKWMFGMCGRMYMEPNPIFQFNSNQIKLN